MRLPVALGAGVPVGLRGLRGWALGFAIRVGPGRGFKFPVGVRHCIRWGCLCGCLGSGGGGQQHCLEDLGVFAVGGGP